MPSVRPAGLAVERGERDEPLGLAADDRQHHRQLELRGADRRLRAAADGQPDRQRLLHRPRVDAEAGDRRAALGARPRDALAAADELEQQLELGREQLVVVVEVLAEERERLGERPAAGHDLRAPVREAVDRGEVLEDADGVLADSTVTAVESRMRSVRAAIAPSTTAGAPTA